MAVEWIQVDVLHRLLAECVPVHASTARRLAHVDPVGSAIAGTRETLGIHKRLQQQRPIAILRLPVLRQLAGRPGENHTRQRLLFTSLSAVDLQRADAEVRYERGERVEMLRTVQRQSHCSVASPRKKPGRKTKPQRA